MEADGSVAGVVSVAVSWVEAEVVATVLVLAVVELVLDVLLEEELLELDVLLEEELRELDLLLLEEEEELDLLLDDFFAFSDLIRASCFVNFLRVLDDTFAFWALVRPLYAFLAALTFFSLDLLVRALIWIVTASAAA